MNVVTRQVSEDHRGSLERLRAFIEAGGYGPGDRLPPERELIQRLDLSRTTLRKALDALEREGAIWRHVGKGTFIANEASVASALTRQVTPVKLVRARMVIEPAIAREAAINASAEAVSRLKLAEARAAQAGSWAEYEERDDAFHCAIAEATDNILLLSLFETLNKTSRAIAGVNVVRETSRPSADHSSFAEHSEIVAAIETRDPHRSFDAMRRHIGSVSARLFGEV